MDIFAAAGLDKPDISVLSDEFLAEVRGMPHRNLAVELLQKLLKGELSARRRKNLVQARSFAEMLEQSLSTFSAKPPILILSHSDLTMRSPHPRQKKTGHVARPEKKRNKPKASKSTFRRSDRFKNATGAVLSAYFGGSDTIRP